MRAFILAAGLGTRLRPLTDDKPKALVKVAGMTMLERTLHTLSRAGVDSFVVNIHHYGDKIVDFLKKHNNFGYDITISDERDLLRDTGGALKHAAPLLKGDGKFLIHNVDIVSNLDIPWFVGRSLATDAEAALLVSDRKTSRYLLFNDDDMLVGWTNVATGEVKTRVEGLQVDGCKKKAFSGIHMFSDSLLKLMKPYPEKFSVIDFYLDVCQTHKIEAVEYPSLVIQDLGTPDAVAGFSRKK
ncbi:MAG: NTP transferase domain-containing protein [Bacteroidales bacterium]|nr:NTP transferase domain-containing protein [Bacteroidales bacterium]